MIDYEKGLTELHERALRERIAELECALEKISKVKGSSDKLVCLVTIDWCADIAKNALGDE